MSERKCMARGCTAIATDGIQLFLKHFSTEKVAEIYINLYACPAHKIDEEVNKLIENNWPQLTKGFNLLGHDEPFMFSRWRWVPIEEIEKMMKTQLAAENEENPYRM